MKVVVFQIATDEGLKFFNTEEEALEYANTILLPKGIEEIYIRRVSIEPIAKIHADGSIEVLPRQYAQHR